MPPVEVATRESVTADRIYAAVAGAAAVVAFLDPRNTPLTSLWIVIALLPWVAVLIRREPPLWLFAAVAILPVVPAVLVEGAGAVIFLTTAAASRVASRADDVWLVAATAVVATALPFSATLTLGVDPGEAYFAFGTVFGVLVGLLLRRAMRLAAALRAAQARLADAAAREERTRIARDVHDLVAHSLTVVVLHIGGARRVLRADPEVAQQALADAERVCRESLDGIRGVVGLLRDADDVPGLSLDVEQLVGTYRATGLPVVLTLDGEWSALPLAARVTLFRVVQESLANAARYGGGATDVRVVVEAGAASASIASRPGASRPATSSGGYGITGLREQVAAMRGELSSGPDAGGWLVECRLPLAPALAAPTGGDA